jgi:hypothetical protein
MNLIHVQSKTNQLPQQLPSWDLRFHWPPPGAALHFALAIACRAPWRGFALRPSVGGRQNLHVLNSCSQMVQMARPQWPSRPSQKLPVGWPQRLQAGVGVAATLPSRTAAICSCQVHNVQHQRASSLARRSSLSSRCGQASGLRLSTWRTLSRSARDWGPPTNCATKARTVSNSLVVTIGPGTLYKLKRTCCITATSGPFGAAPKVMGWYLWAARPGMPTASATSWVYSTAWSASPTLPGWPAQIAVCCCSNRPCNLNSLLAGRLHVANTRGKGTGGFRLQTHSQAHMRNT